jgi:hypothetical protein
MHELAIANDPGLRTSQRLQPRQGGFGPLFLIEAERCVEQQNQTNGCRFNRPCVSAFLCPEPDIEGQS